MSEEKQIMPVVALKGITMLPGMLIHFDIQKESSISAIKGMFTTIVNRIGRSATIAASQARIFAAPFGVMPTAKYLANSRLR